MNSNLYFIYAFIIGISLIIYYYIRDKDQLEDIVDLLLLIIEGIIGGICWIGYVPILIILNIYDSFIDITSNDD